MPDNNSYSARQKHLRTYEPIWLKLKRDCVCIVQIGDVRLKNRVIKAVKQEKYKDLGFKVINDIENFYLRTYWDEEKKEIKFTLQSRFGLTDMKS